MTFFIENKRYNADIFVPLRRERHFGDENDGDDNSLNTNQKLKYRNQTMTRKLYFMIALLCALVGTAKAEDGWDIQASHDDITNVTTFTIAWRHIQKICVSLQSVIIEKKR